MPSRVCWFGLPSEECRRGYMPKPQLSGVSLYRRLMNYAAMSLAAFSAIVVLAPLFAILIYLLMKGVSAINWAFLTQIPKPVGEVGGGMANAIWGSGEILAIASLIGIPLGIAGGIHLAEYGRHRFADGIRFMADVLNGIPSIVIGMAIYGLVVVTQRHFSALAGGIALGVIIIPTVMRATEEMLLMVPHSVREAALGLGISQWRTTIFVTLRTATSGVITGIMLAFARVAGETAPLLFTAFGNQFWTFAPNQPTAALPLQIFTYAISPFDEWHRQAWAGALVLIVLIVGTVSVVRFVFRGSALQGAR